MRRSHAGVARRAVVVEGVLHEGHGQRRRMAGMPSSLSMSRRCERRARRRTRPPEYDTIADGRARTTPRGSDRGGSRVRAASSGCTRRSRRRRRRRRGSRPASRLEAAPAPRPSDAPCTSGRAASDRPITSGSTQRNAVPARLEAGARRSAPPRCPGAVGANGAVDDEERQVSTRPRRARAIELRLGRAVVHLVASSRA